MNINIIFEHGGQDWTYKSIFHTYFDQCSFQNPNINFTSIDSLSIPRPEHMFGANSKYGPFYMMIQNPDNQKYILVSYWDKLLDITKHYSATGFDLENCVEIITSAGGHSDDITYKPLNYNYTPHSYIGARTENESIIEQLYTNTHNRITPDKPIFRGYLYQFRKFLENDVRFNIIDKNTNYLGYDNYIKELNLYNINLSLNGAGEICHRDIEILGLGTALLRFKLVTKFHNELIPDYHYISVPYDDLEFTDMNTYFHKLSDRMIDRFNQVKDDKEYINFVADNGRKWYIENGTVNANVNILNKLIDFNKLR